MHFTISAFLLLSILVIRYISGAKRLHIDLFIFGSLYYLILPGVVYEWKLIQAFPGIALWYDITSNFFDYQYQSFLLLVYGWVAMFIIGSISLKLMHKTNTRIAPLLNYKIEPPLRIIVASIVILLTGILAFYVFEGKGIIGRGYATQYNQYVLGGISTISLVLYGMYLQIMGQRTSALNYCIIILLFSVFVILFSSGSRMYILIPTTGFFIVLLMKYNNMLKRLLIALSMILMAYIFTIVGIWRLDSLSYEAMLYILLAEPIFTFYSAATFWMQNSFCPFEIPLNAFSGILNLVPSIFLHDKSTFFITIKDMGYSYQAPLGATSAIVSIIGGFGIIGSFILIYILGALLESLYFHSKYSSSALSSYIILVSTLPFMFFRDALHIFLKVVLTLTILLPLFLELSSIIIKGAVNGIKRGSMS